jgi:putative tryptophan/tyrosine transport system substrate-binding protein
MFDMIRRDFIALLGGAAAWPIAARAQQRERVQQIGVLMAGANSDPDEQFRLTAFQNGLRGLGWAQGHNIQIDIRKAAGEAERFRPYAVELVAAKPDVLMADTSPSTAALQRETHTIPIVFVRVSDPVGQGFVADMARPGGNITGFTNYESAMSGKWVDLLKEAVPNIKRVALIDCSLYTILFANFRGRGTRSWAHARKCSCS